MGKLEFTTKQIIEYVKYNELCDLFLQLAKDNETKTKLQGILYKGAYKNYVFCSNICNRNNVDIERRRRASMAYLLINNPDTFEELAQNNINLFHGTKGSALPSIAKYGLNSLAKSEEQGIHVSTGEIGSQAVQKRTFVSFTDVLDIAENYSMLPEENDNLSFEVIIGTTKEDVSNAGKVNINSAEVEVGVLNNLKTDLIKVICVPSDKVNLVKKIIDNQNIKVLAIDNICNKFYFIDGLLYSIDVNVEKYNKFQDNLNNSTKKFDLHQIKALVLERPLLNIKKQLDKIKSTISKDDVDSDYRRVK